MQPIVAISEAESVEQGLPQALDLLGDISALFRGKHVAIKPNETWASPSDTTPCTQSDTVRAAIRYVKRFDPSRITVTGGSGAAETDDVFRILGIDRVIREEEVEFFDHNRSPFTSVALESGPQREVMVNPRVFEYETLVSLAQHKVHYEATVTLTMKNIAMSYPAADYYGHPRSTRKHPHSFYKDMQGFIAAMCRRFPINLGIIVGHPAMIGRGPIGGKTFETGLTVAGQDYVAVDAVGAHILGKDHVGHILQAAAQGQGTADRTKIEIAGVPLEDALRIFTERAGETVYG